MQLEIPAFADMTAGILFWAVMGLRRYDVTINERVAISAGITTNAVMIAEILFLNVMEDV